MAGVRRRALAISWAMPPALYPRALQVSRTLAALGRLGWDATVICADARSIPGAKLDDALAREYIGAYRAVAVDLAAPERLWIRLRRGQMRPSADERWCDQAIRAARLEVDRSPCDVVLSFAQPWSDHLVGLAIRERSGVPWIAHFSDPWVDSPYYADRPAEEMALWRTQEHAVIQMADAVVFVTEQTAALVMAKYPRPWQQKVEVIPHGFDLRLRRPGMAPRARAKCVLVHTGDFYGRRGPEQLLMGLYQLRDRNPEAAAALEFVSVGDASPESTAFACELDLGEMVRFTGKRAFGEAMQIAADADALVLIDADVPNSVFLPSKLIDYLMLRKPILGLTPAAGASADVLRRLGFAPVPPGDPAAIADAIATIVERWRGGSLAVGAAFDDGAAAYDIDATAARLESLMSRVAGKRRA